MSMKNLGKSIVCMVLAMVFVWVSFAPVFAGTAAVEKTVKGKLEKVEPCYIIKDERRGDFIIKGANLDFLDGKQVQVTGVLTKDKKGHKVIEVKDYEEVK